MKWINRLPGILLVTQMFFVAFANAEVGSVGPGGLDEEGFLHQQRSLYQNVFVYEKGEVRCMRFTRHLRSGDAQSCMYVDDPQRLFFDYAKLAITALYLQPEPARILVLGLGGGSIPAAFAKVLPSAKIDTVEIDPVVTEVAERYFAYADNDRLTNHDVDGRVFVKRAGLKKHQWDIVVLDAFNGDYIPEHLLTREFLEEVKAIIAPDGVLAANTFSHSKLYDSESATYEEVFGDFFNLRVTLGNRVILWRKGGLPDMQELVKNAESYAERFEPLGIDRFWALPLFSRKKNWDSEARVLTDQYSPSNLLNTR
jgi:spermidine synthase